MVGWDGVRDLARGVLIARAVWGEKGDLSGVEIERPQAPGLDGGGSVGISPAYSHLPFNGDVYTGVGCEAWEAADFTFAQKHLRIPSGLYGILRPLDLMQAYRLEMGTDLSTRRGENLYDFWGEKITAALNGALAEARSKVLVNLASNEYLSAVQPAALNAEVVTPVFKDFKNGKYKFVSFYGKKARGMMADFIVRGRVKKAEDLQVFDSGGYYFDPESSEGGKLTFLRDEPQ